MPLTYSLSGLLRSGAGRSGWPIAVGLVLETYALSGVARAGATRSNYHSPKAFISLNGVHVGTGQAVAGQGLTIEGFAIDDAINQAPSTARARAWGFLPTVGQDVIVTLGSKNNLRRTFGGTVLSLTQGYLGQKPANRYADLNLIDYTWGMNKRKVIGHYTGSASTIAASLISTYAPGYTARRVEAGMPTVDGGITFTNQDLTDCLTALMKRVGGNWFCDYDKDVSCYLTDTSTSAPVIINTVHRSLAAFSVSRDLSQLLTRVYMEGGGSAAFSAVAIGETILPVTDAGWYELAGGVVISGPERITYTEADPGGGGGLVGPGAAPSAAAVVAPTSGAGIESGAHNYAVTFVTASGESISGPVAAITVGAVTPPASRPITGEATIGTGPDPGTHVYAVTFVNVAGETPAAGPGSGIIEEGFGTTLETPPPTTSPTPASLSAGGSVDAGAHDYAATFITSIGETTPSPIGGSMTTGGAAAAPPSTAPTAGTPTVGGSVDDGAHVYATTFVAASGETTPGPNSGTVTTRVVPAPSSYPSVAKDLGGNLSDGAYRHRVTFVNAAGETTVSNNSGPLTLDGVSTPNAPTFNNAGAGGIESGSYRWKLTFTVPTGETEGSDAYEFGGFVGPAFITFNIITGPSGVTSRKLYRSWYSGSAWEPYKLAATVSNNTATTITDSTPNASLGATIPSSNTAKYHKINLTSIPVSADATVTARKIYRTEAGSSTPYKLVTTINNNTATTYTDNTADASLGADAPSSNTATVRTVALSSIPTGPAGTTARKVYRTAAGGSQLKLLTTISNNFSTTLSDTIADASLGANIPTGAATLNTVNLTTIPLGDANVTSRKLYRRSGGAGLKLLATIANNTATTYADTTANAGLGSAVPSVSTAYLQRIPLTAIPTSADPTVTARKLYRTVANGATLKLLATLADNTTTVFTDTVTDASLGADVPSSNTATANQVALSSIPIGASGVTSRKVYRTTAGGAQLKLQQTIADNTTTTGTDSTADGSLGANVPTADASGLPQPSGNVLAGSTSLITAGTGGFSASGGWAVIGNGEQVIRYTGVTVSALTGIPASGPGSIVASIGYNSTVTAAPCLRGIPASGPGSIQYPILRGDDINLLVQVDDAAAQTELAALIGGDGIQEEYLQDRRLAYAEALSRAQAHLDLHSAIDVSISYTSRDLNTRAGATVQVNLGPPTSVVADFLIQRVTITDFRSPSVMPTHHVQASSTRFSFTDLLRLAKGAG